MLISQILQFGAQAAHPLVEVKPKPSTQLAGSHFAPPFTVHSPGVQFVSQATQAPLYKAKPYAQAVQVIAKFAIVHVEQFETGPVVLPPYTA